MPETNLTGVPFPEGVWLSGADLSGANLEGVDLSGANLFGADLSEARLRTADLTDANIANANLTGADLQSADLSGATFQAADLSGAALQEATLVGADLWAADLSAASLQAADLQNALLAETTLADVSLARSTRIDNPKTRIEEKEDFTIPQAGVYDTIARTNHELRAAYSDNGLIGRARRARVRERNARRKEALAEKSWRGTVTWGWSLLSKVFTGYGVQLRWIVLMMLLLYLGSAGVYWWQGMALNRGLYYSVITFTTSPPKTPSPGIATAVAGIETFAGTAAIVLLGYILGTRERV